MRPDPKYLLIGILTSCAAPMHSPQGQSSTIPVPKVGLQAPPAAGQQPTPQKPAAQPGPTLRPAGAQPGAPLPIGPPQPGQQLPGQPIPGQQPGQQGAPMVVTAVRPAPGMEPKLVFNKMSHDFGEVEEGRAVDTLFEFKNEGKGPAQILTIQTKCSCTVPAGIEVEGRTYAYGDPIPVGAKGTIRTRVETSGFFDDKDTGANLITNDPSWPETNEAQFGLVPLKIHLKIIRRYVFKPASLVEMGEISTSDPREVSVVFETTKGEPFQILGFESADKTALQMFELRAEPIDSTLLRWNISMSLSPSAPFGPFVKEFKVVAKPPAPSTSFQVRGTVFGPVKVEPAQLHFLVVNKGRVATKTLFVRNSHAGFPLKISNVRLLDPRDNRALAGGPAVPLATEAKDHLVWNIKETDPGKVSAIEVIVKETMPQMSFNAVLAFDTGVPGSSPNGSGEMRVLVTGVVR